MRQSLLCCFLLLVTYNDACSQSIINSYAKVTAIASNTFTVSNVNETYDSFEDGDYVIVMQMQDNVIGTNTSNNSSFGNLNTIQSAGLFEIKQILSHTEVGSVPNSITFTSATNYSYQSGSNSSLQIISFPTLGAPNYTTTSDLGPLAWNGNIGGIIAFNVDGTLTLSHNINANYTGFRGGSKSANYYSGGTGCNTTEYIRTSNHTRAGQKGEGIYKTSNNDYLYARGKLLNGGGGGSERINCGGGGGGNYTAGGEGGFGWSCPSGPGGGGIGGLALNTNISGSRVYLGGGGGGGQQNNSASTDGGIGGGIILIKANTITSSCGSSLNISANGQQPINAGNDGGGGGGAGGSILLDVQSWTIPGTCPLSITANGGGGSNNGTGSYHAGGGGGGQGVIIFNIAIPSANTTTQTNNGAGGVNCSSCTAAQSGSGSNGSGVIGGTGGSLPIELIDFKVTLINEKEAQLNWRTASELNNDYFLVEKSLDGQDWKLLEHIKGAGNSSKELAYQTTDYLNDERGIIYYRLKQVDFDGSFELSKVISITPFNNHEKYANIYPNPFENKLTIKTLAGSKMHIINVSGIMVYETTLSESQNEVDLDFLPKGFYIISVANQQFKIQKN